MKPLCIFIGLFVSAELAIAQLAITEVMSSALNRFGAGVVSPGPDYWELTNFGTNDMDLTGYSWGDDQMALPPGDYFPFIKVVIRKGESIVFFRPDADILSAEAFRLWWNLGPSVQVIPYTSDIGLSKGGDRVVLWRPNAFGDADVVDAVTFGAAKQGTSFTYDSAGKFGVLSQLGVGSAFRAATSGDVGSPGTNAGPVRLKVLKLDDIVAYPSETATFSVSYEGLPRPKFQWYRDGTPIWDATSPVYSIPDVHPERSGQYAVMLEDIFGTASNATARLTVVTNPTPPFFRLSPAELRVFEDQPAVFHARAVGVPVPTYQWRLHGTNLSGQTGRDLEVSQFQPLGTHEYAVVASNEGGAVTNVARLIVTERPDLRITEVMPSQRDTGPNEPKLVNSHQSPCFGSNTVDLIGYRFDDESVFDDGNPRPHLPLAWILTNHVYIHHLESVIFTELDAEAFRSWWGWNNLPPNLQIIQYSPGGRGLSEDAEDGLGFWNSGATSDEDVVNVVKDYALVSYVTNDIVTGVSFTIDPQYRCCYLRSQTNVNGAFAAVENGDIGSPGYIREPTDVRVLHMSAVASGCQLIWRSVQTGSYRIEYKDGLGGAWNLLAPVSREGSTTTFVDTTLRENVQRFYRVVLEQATE